MNSTQTLRKPLALLFLLLCTGLATGLASASASAKNTCPDSALTANVVAIDHPMVFNRLGAQNVNWMMYALRHDVLDLNSRHLLDYTPEGEALFQQAKNKHSSRDIALRPDLRPRPLVLRVAEGDYLKVRFTNLLHAKPVPPRSPDDPFPNQANPFDSYPNPLPEIDHSVEHAAKDASGTLPRDKIFRLDDQVVPVPGNSNTDKGAVEVSKRQGIFALASYPQS